MKVGDLTPRIRVICDVSVKDDNYNDYIGDLKVEALYIPTCEEDEFSSVQNFPIVRNLETGGLLTVIIHGAVLHHQERHSSVSLFFGGEIRKTKVCF